MPNFHQKLLSIARPVSFLKGAQLVRQGETSRGAFLLRSGEVEVLVAVPGGGTLNVAVLREGEVFGEMALIERGVCSATVIAKSNVDGWFVERADLRALVASRDAAAQDIQRAITRVLADRLRLLNDRVKDHPAAEDRPIGAPAPASDPLSGVARSRHASFDWRAFLQALPFFDDFDSQEADELVSAGKVLELARGDWVFCAGTPASACYLVVRGALEIFTRSDRKERRVAIAGPGELVGFMALINDAPRANHARVRESCCLLEIPRAAFREIYDGASGTSVSLQQAIHRSLMRSIARTNTQLTRLISHARLSDSGKLAAELEGVLHAQVVQSSSLTET